MKYKIEVSSLITCDQPYTHNYTFWFWEVRVNNLYIYKDKDYSTRNSAIKAAKNAMKKLGLGDDCEVKG